MLRHFLCPLLALFLIAPTGKKQENPPSKWSLVGFLTSSYSKTGAELILRDKSGQESRIVVPLSVVESHNGLETLLNRWVLVTAERTSEQPDVWSAEQVDVIPADVRRYPLDPRVQSALPADFASYSRRNLRDTPQVNHKIVNLLVRFSDYTQITPEPVQWFHELFRNTWPGLNHYYTEVSYGQYQVNNALVLGWKNLSQPLVHYLTDPNSSTSDFNPDIILAEALPWMKTQADLSDADCINIYPNMPDRSGTSYCRYVGGYDLVVNGKHHGVSVTVENWADQSTTVHEMGHGIGLDHTSGPYANGKGSKWDPMGNGIAYYTNITNLGSMTVSDGFNAYHRYREGWIAKSQIFYALPGTNKQIRLERLNQPKNPGYLMAKIYIGGSATHYYTVEARRYAGYDAKGNLPGECVVIHDCDEHRVGEGNLRNQSQVVDPDNNGDPNDAAAQWLPGETYQDTLHRTSIHIDSMDATGFKVTISVDPKQPMPNVVGNTNDAGSGSLRNALAFHHDVPSLPIKFAIPHSDPGFNGKAFVIPLQGPLPDIVDAGTQIDASSEAATVGNSNGNGPLVFLDGTNAGIWVSGLNIKATNCLVRGLGIGNFNSDGIHIDGATASQAVIQHCFLGIGPDGSTAWPNWTGIHIYDGASACVVGGGTTSGNVISGNITAGVLISAASQNRVFGNLIGTDAGGTTPVPNQQQGVQIDSGAVSNQIGGVATGQGNLISGNDGNGIILNGSEGTLVEGNLIGLAQGGEVALGNQVNGIQIDNAATGNHIMGNVIAASAGCGIWLINDGTTNNVIQANKLGTDVTGTIAVPNTGAGIVVSKGANGNTIGGSSPPVANLVSGNGGCGISLNGSEGTLVEGNLIGLAQGGEVALGNQVNGIQVDNAATKNRILGNVIAASKGCGIWLIDSGTTNNVIQANKIGTDITGAHAMPNLRDGINIDYGAANNLIGGSSAVTGNIIAFNGGSGVGVGSNTAVGNTIRCNCIFQNNGLGINLYANDGAYGITPNDTLDADTGPNNLQNFPIITNFRQGSTANSTTCTLNSLPNTKFFIDVYGQVSADSSGYGEGDTYLGSVSVTTDKNGDAQASVKLAPDGTFSQLSATATNSVTGDTSEFGPNLILPTPLSLIVAPSTVRGGNAATATLRLAWAAPTGGITVKLSSDSTLATVPATLVVPANSAIGTFTVHTVAVKSHTSVTLKASVFGIDAKTTLTLTP